MKVYSADVSNAFLQALPLSPSTWNSPGSDIPPINAWCSIAQYTDVAKVPALGRMNSTLISPAPDSHEPLILVYGREKGWKGMARRNLCGRLDDLLQ